MLNLTLQVFLKISYVSLTDLLRLLEERLTCPDSVDFESVLLTETAEAFIVEIWINLNK